MAFPGIPALILLAGTLLAWLQALAYAADFRDFRARCLAGLFLCMGAWHLEGSLVKTGLMPLVPGFKFATIPFVYWTGPLAYLYFSSLLRDGYVFARRELLHPAPGALMCLGWIFLIVASPEERRLMAAMEPEYLPVQIFRILNGLGILTGLVYLVIVSVRYIYPGRPRLTPGTRAGLFVGIILLLTALVYELLRNFDIYWNPSLFLMLNSFFVTAVLVIRVGRPDFMERFAAAIRENRYRRSRLGSRDLGDIREELNVLMEERRLYLNEELTLGDLADHLGLSAEQLSQFINQEMGRNFNTYVNEYRVAAAGRLLLEKPRETVLNVGLDSGFKSSSAFQAVFKSITGMSPGRWRKTGGVLPDSPGDSQ